jgi:Holliday junction resolvase RusA-like endonuclease
MFTRRPSGGLEFELPYPPSVNHYWRRVGPRTLISREGRAYREVVCSILAARLGGQASGVRPLTGPIHVVVELHPPDRRRRDCDNAMKALLDACAKGGAYRDDSQIKDLEVHMREPAESGRAIVRIEEVRP